MDKSDKIVFWIIETLIIILVLTGAYYILKEYHSLAGNYVTPLQNWILQMYRVLPEISLGGIFEGTIMNISALLTAKLKFFGKLSWLDKILMRLSVAVFALFISHITILVILIYMRN